MLFVTNLAGRCTLSALQAVPVQVNSNAAFDIFLKIPQSNFSKDKQKAELHFQRACLLRIKSHMRDWKPLLSGIAAAHCPGLPCAGSYVHLDVNIDDTVEYVLGCAQKARSSFRSAFAIPEYVRGALERFAPDDVSKSSAQRLRMLQLLLAA